MAMSGGESVAGNGGELRAAVESSFARRLPDVPLAWSTSGRDPCLSLPASCLAAAAALLKEDPATDFAFLACVTGVDRHPAEPRFEVIYHLRSLSLRRRLVVRTAVPGDRPSLPSVTRVWRAADWLEREVFDLLGIVFEGHPDLRRILLPADWEGFPLRKDYPLAGPAEAEP